ncbi:MAG: phosphatidylserine decarboxylase [Endomicrobium sp.]|nr:phosphatidylserine decarboxylase [Endomicrobium sp.]
MRIVNEGWPFIIPLLSISLFLLILGKCMILLVIGIIFFILACFCAYFFRDPKVNIIKNDNVILSPCNGTVLEVNINNTNTEVFIRVFLSIFDIHLQRSPVSGQVTNIEYKSGKFFNAMDKRAHIYNEQNIITIKNNTGKYYIKQIAGILARRCITWVKLGDVLKQGDKIGMIKFGSQVDLYMPNNVNIKVKKGDKVISGITVIAVKINL